MNYYCNLCFHKQKAQKFSNVPRSFISDVARKGGHKTFSLLKCLLGRQYNVSRGHIDRELRVQRTGEYDNKPRGTSSPPSVRVFPSDQHSIRGLSIVSVVTV